MIHILTFPMHEKSRKPDGEERWCFTCRKRRTFEMVIDYPTLDPDIPPEEQTGAYYGPSARVECTHCKTTDGDCFPGTGREWNHD